MNQLRQVAGIFLSKLLGLIIFLVILGLMNFLIPYVNEKMFSAILQNMKEASSRGDLEQGGRF